MDTLLAKLPAGGVMSFLMLSASFWAILNVSKEDAKYPTGLKRIVLLIAWIIALLSLLTFFLSIYEIIVPILNSLPMIEIPIINVNVSTLVNYVIFIIILVVITFISSYVLRKLQRFLPKGRDTVMMEELIKELENISKEFVNLSRESNGMAKQSLNLLKESRDYTKEVTEKIIHFENTLSSQTNPSNNIKENKKSKTRKKVLNKPAT